MTSTYGVGWCYADLHAAARQPAREKAPNGSEFDLIAKLLSKCIASKAMATKRMCLIKMNAD